MKKLFIKRKNLKDPISEPQKVKNIHEQIEETIAERKRILPEWELLFQEKDPVAKNDIHIQLRETILAFKKTMRQHHAFFIANKNKKAA